MNHQNGDAEIRWFGTIRGQGAAVPVPVGSLCYHCEEAIVAEDSGIQYPDGDVAHRNCHLRQIIGSVAHVERRCGCYVSGSEENDPPGLSLRQAADAAVAAFEKRRMAVN